VAGVSSAALVAAYFLGVKDPEVITGLGAVVGLIPTAITWMVELLKSLIQPDETAPVDEGVDVDVTLIRELGALREEGVLTQEEFDAKKTDLLNL
jgi:hypothetical protein